MTTNKPREVERHEVRAICAAGGEVTDGDGDVWCEVKVELVYRNARGAFTVADLVLGDHYFVSGPFTVTKEPPAKASPWRRGVPEKSGWHWFRTSAGATGLCRMHVNKFIRLTGLAATFAEFAGAETRDAEEDAGWFDTTEFAPLRERAPE